MERDLSTLRFVIYRRKSSEDDSRQVQSLAGQRAEIKALIERHRLNVVKDIHESRSAKEPGRTGFNEMIALLKSGQANAILCWKADRLARNLIDGGEITHQISNGGIKAIITPNGNHFPQDSTLPLLFEFGIAHQFVRDLSSNVKRGMLQKCQQGWYPGIPPIGYANDTTNVIGERTIKTDTQRLDKVKRLWHLLLYEGKTVGEIARTASSQLRLTTLPRRKTGGKVVSRSTIYNMFHNPFYSGRFQINGLWYDGKHEAIITWEEFERAQKLIKSRNVHGSMKGKKPIDFDLRGSIRCGECGCMVVGERKKKTYKNGRTTHYEYYHCSWRKKNYQCRQKSIQGDDAKDQLSSLIEAVTVPNQYLELALKHLEASRCQEKDRRLEAHQILIRQQESHFRGLKHLDDVYFSSENHGYVILSTESFVLRKKNYQKELDELKEKIENFDHYQKKTLDLTVETFEFCRRLKQHFESATPERKVQILQVLGSKVALKDKEISLELKKPFEIIKHGLKSKSLTFEPTSKSLQKGSKGINETSCSFWLPRLDSNQ